MAHQRLNRPEVVPLIQKGSGKGMPDHMRMNPLFDQSLCCDGLDQAVNRLGCEFPFLVWAMLPQSIEDRMIRVHPIPGCLQVVLDGNQGFRVQGDSPELLSLDDDIKDGLVPVSLYVPNLQVTEFESQTKIKMFTTLGAMSVAR
jgi:hypothetical protein